MYVYIKHIFELIECQIIIIVIILTIAIVTVIIPTTSPLQTSSQTYSTLFKFAIFRHHEDSTRNFVLLCIVVTIWTAFILGIIIVTIHRFAARSEFSFFKTNCTVQFNWFNRVITSKYKLFQLRKHFRRRLDSPSQLDKSAISVNTE